MTNAEIILAKAFRELFTKAPRGCYSQRINAANRLAKKILEKKKEEAAKPALRTYSYKPEATR